MSPRTVEFWFEFASTYSYPAAARIDRVAGDVPVLYRPFLLGPLFRAQGWDDSPFNLYPAKGRYMWRDLARVCAAEGLGFRRPSVFPRNGLLAARLATAAEGESWLPAFVRATYDANFVGDRDIADPAVLASLLEARGVDPGAWLARAGEDAVKARLRERTEEASRKGVFGAPSFVVGDELFWGNDRLEMALAAARA